jgi:hypothetical protein
MTDASIIAEAPQSADEDEVPAHIKRKQRSCLMCHSAFDSAWAGERICRRCKSSANWQSGQSS